jgi:hypothetical protein
MTTLALQMQRTKLLMAMREVGPSMTLSAVMEYIETHEIPAETLEEIGNAFCREAWARTPARPNGEPPRLPPPAVD